MNLALFGTGNFSCNVLSGILENNEINLKLLVSQPDKPFGRKQTLIPTPIKKFALEKEIIIFQPEKLKNNIEFFNFLKSLNLDFIIVVAYGKIIPKEILEIPKYGCINIHGSILPKYRGASPIQESLKNGDKKTGLTIMCMSEKMDEGKIFKIQEIDINIFDKAIDIFQKFEFIAPQLLLNTLKQIISGEIKGILQDDTKATYCKKIEKEDGKIDFKNESALQIYNKFRAYYIWPGIFTYFEGKKIDIKDCFFLENDFLFNKNFSIGSVIELEENGKNNIGILCNKGILILKRIKCEGKKELDIKDFINGNKKFLNYNFCN